MSTTSHLEKLSGPQRKAVAHGEPFTQGTTRGVKAGPLLVVAGAGTGKTNTLAHRVAHLAIHGVDPARILMLTFTRRAAGEMRRRAQEIVYLEDPGAIWLYDNYHVVAMRRDIASVTTSPLGLVTFEQAQRVED